MAYEMIVGLNVTDNEKYAEYRRLMTPLLEQHDGGFRYDFIVSDVLICEENKPINRVFAIFFGSRGQMEGFFSNTDYLAIKEQYFAPSVEDVVVLNEYER